MPAPAQPASTSLNKLMPDQQTGELQFFYQLQRTSDVTLRILTPGQQQVYRMDYPGQPTGKYLQTVNLRQIPKGEYRLLIETEGNKLKEYQILKRF
jgi:hypothetical protein